MAVETPEIALVEPSGWSEAREVGPPRITPSATLTSFRAIASPSGDAVLVRGCVASSIPGWVEDMRPAVDARTLALLGAATEKATTLPMDARTEPTIPAGAFALRLASRLDGPRIGLGRPFVGFDDGRVLTCFASCVSRPPRDVEHGATLGCESAVANAHLSPEPPPPPPGILLGAVTWAVHHPRSFATSAGVLVLVVIVLALVFRPRPRSRIFKTRTRAR